MLGRLISEIFSGRQATSQARGKENDPNKAVTTGTNHVSALDEWTKRRNSLGDEDSAALLPEFAEWVRHHPSKQSWVQLGDWQLRYKQYDAAEFAYRQALRIDPRSPSAQEGIGSLMLSLRDFDQAYLHFEAADRFRPFHAPTLNQWGLVCLEQGNLTEASKHFEQAVEADVNFHHAWHNLGLINVMAGYPMKGVQHFQRAVTIQPKFGLAYSNMALALRDAEKLSEAMQAAEQATIYKSDSVRVWVIAADISIDAGLFKQAQGYADHAVELNPRDVGVHIVFAKLHTQTRNYDKAKYHYITALEIDPHNAEAEGGLGQLELLLGEWESGWGHYEARRRTQPPSVRKLGLPLWDGSLTPNTHLLVYAEQGLGDILLFGSCMSNLLREAAQSGCNLTMETYPRLEGLLSRSLPEVNVVGHDARDSDTHWLQRLQCTHEVPIGSLPQRYRYQSSCFANQGPYLVVDRERVKTWGQTLRNHFGSRRRLVSLTWRGGMLRSAGAQRSLSLMSMLTSLQISEEVCYVLLQHGDVQDEVDALPEHLRLRCWYAPEATHDLDDTAALTCVVSAVVTVCGTQAHLTGALGRSGAVLVPSNPNWRYGHQGPSTPWYPSLQLFRQPVAGEWGVPLSGVQDWLRSQLQRQAELSERQNEL